MKKVYDARQLLKEIKKTKPDKVPKWMWFIILIEVLATAVLMLKRYGVMN